MHEGHLVKSFRSEEAHTPRAWWVYKAIAHNTTPAIIACLANETNAVSCLPALDAVSLL